MKLVHWSLMGELLHLVQRGGDCLNGQSNNHRIGPLHCGFNVPVKGLSYEYIGGVKNSCRSMPVFR